LPAELTGRARWVRRSARKVPLTTDGMPASSTGPATWATYPEAKTSDAGVGLGFVLDGDGVVCLDLDHCLTDGVLAGWAVELLEQLPPTYTEVSPSGEGLHVWGFGSAPRGRLLTIPGGGRSAVYGWGRYITVTGWRWQDAPSRLADLSVVLAALGH